MVMVTDDGGDGCGGVTDDGGDGCGGVTDDALLLHFLNLRNARNEARFENGSGTRLRMSYPVERATNNP